MKIIHNCCRDVQTAKPGDLVRVVAARMHQHDVGTVVVVDADRHPLGIVTDRDLALRIIAADRLPSVTRVEDVMTALPHTVRDTVSKKKALDELRRHRVQRLPVVDEGGRLVGIVSVHDLVPRRVVAADAPTRRKTSPKPQDEVIERSSGELEC